MVAPESAGDRPQPAEEAERGADAESPSSAEAAYVKGLIARGEAAKAVDGKLPPGATHEIVEERPGQLPKLVRRRFA
jgi:hypothetical protein